LRRPVPPGWATATRLLLAVERPADLMATLLPKRVS
jgi:hypothetical protein